MKTIIIEFDLKGTIIAHVCIDIKTEQNHFDFLKEMSIRKRNSFIKNSFNFPFSVNITNVKTTLL